MTPRPDKRKQPVPPGEFERAMLDFHPNEERGQRCKRCDTIRAAHRQEVDAARGPAMCGRHDGEVFNSTGCPGCAIAEAARREALTSGYTSGVSRPTIQPPCGKCGGESACYCPRCYDEARREGIKQGAEDPTLHYHAACHKEALNAYDRGEARGETIGRRAGYERERID